MLYGLIIMLVFLVIFGSELFVEYNVGVLSCMVLRIGRLNFLYSDGNIIVLVV